MIVWLRNIPRRYCWLTFGVLITGFGIFLAFFLAAGNDFERDGMSPRSFHVLKRVLQGDPRTVSIEPIQPRGSRVGLRKSVELSGRDAVKFCAMLEEHLDVALSSYYVRAQDDEGYEYQSGLELARVTIRTETGKTSILAFEGGYTTVTGREKHTVLYRVNCPGLFEKLRTHVSSKNSSGGGQAVGR